MALHLAGTLGKPHLLEPLLLPQPQLQERQQRPQHCQGTYGLLQRTFRTCWVAEEQAHLPPLLLGVLLRQLRLPLHQLRLLLHQLLQLQVLLPLLRLRLGRLRELLLAEAGRQTYGRSGSSAAARARTCANTQAPHGREQTCGVIAHHSGVIVYHMQHLSPCFPADSSS
jgi:hypothetical protein